MKESGGFRWFMDAGNEGVMTGVEDREQKDSVVKGRWSGNFLSGEAIDVVGVGAFF